jgi:GABA permease
VIFSMVGAEIATIAAAESADPERAVARAANSVILRIAVFFVGSAFLLNSSGAIILFVYLLIAISQIVLRYRTPDSELRVKMWLFPVLSILTALGIVAILVQMFIDKALRSQLVLSLLSWAVVILLFAANKWFVNKRPLEPIETPTAAPHRVLVLANQTLDSHELLAELSRIGADRDARYLVVVPASPVDTGAAATHGPRDVTEATQEAAQARLDATLSALRSENLDAQGDLGDYRPLRALDHAVETFDPDQIVIATLPPELSIWQRFDVVDRARSQLKVPVTHVVAKSAVGNQVPR